MKASATRDYVSIHNKVICRSVYNPALVCVRQSRHMRDASNTKNQSMSAHKRICEAGTTGNVITHGMNGFS